MKLRYLLIVFAVIVGAVFCKAPDIEASTIPSYPILLINLYHPECHRCKDAQKQLSVLHKLSEDRKYQVAEINCEKQTEFCDSIKTTYPKAFLYVEGHQIGYEGEITADQLDKWLQSLIELDLPTLTQDQLKEKQGKQSFLVVGGLNTTEKIQIGAVKFARYIGMEFYQIQSTQKVFSVYSMDKKKKYDITFPLNTRLFAFELFHLTRDHIMSVDKPEYLEYFRTEEDFDQHMILYDHHDKLSQDAYPVLDNICFELAVNVACFKVSKQSPYYQEVVGNFRPYHNRSSIIFSKKQKQKAYIYPNQQFEQRSFKQFLKDAKGKTRIPDYDYVKEANDKMKYQFVTKIDDQEHQQVLKNHTYVFVQYYSPFFQNCTNFVTSYDAVGRNFKGHQKNILIAAVDAEQELALADQQKVSNYPEYKVFVGGEGFPYEGYRTTEGMINFINSVVESKLPKVSQAKDLKKPAVGISGIDEDNYLHALAFFYKDLPIYQIKGEKEFGIHYYKQNGKVEKFTHQTEIQQIVDWYQEQTGPVLVSLGDSKVPKKLQIALKKHKPILGLINKNQKGTVDQEINFLTQYCENRKDFVCGVAHKGEDDYQQMLDYIGDNDEVSNRLVWIDIQNEKVFFYDEDLKSLNNQILNNFIDGIKKKTVSEHQSSKRSEQASQQEQIVHQESDKSDQL